MEENTYTGSSPLDRRYHYYQLGRRYEQAGNLPEAIKAYTTYATHLEEADQHIPEQWLSKLYDQLGDTHSALQCLERHVTGCTPPRAAQIHRDLAERYQALGVTQKAIAHYEQAIANNPSIGVKKELEKLKSGEI